MQISTDGIVVRRIKYGERGNIVHIFTRNSGMRHFIVKSNRRGNSTALFFPLTQLEFVMDSNRDDALGYLKDVRISYPYRNLYQDIKKSAVTIFLAEVLSHVLQHEAQNTALFDFMQRALRDFDQMQDNPDFHILFLLDITEHLGFCPQRWGGGSLYRSAQSCDHTQSTDKNQNRVSNVCGSNNKGKDDMSGGRNSDKDYSMQSGMQNDRQSDLLGGNDIYFDLQDGCFCTKRPLHDNYFEGKKARLFSNLVHKREVGERLPLLEALLSYYRIHTATGSNIHSLSILHEVFL